MGFQADYQMANPDYSDLVTRQREYFLSGSTRPVAWRKAQFEAVKAFVEHHNMLPRGIKLMADDVATYSKIVKAAGITPQ